MSSSPSKTVPTTRPYGSRLSYLITTVSNVDAVYVTDDGDIVFSLQDDENTLKPDFGGGIVRDEELLVWDGVSLTRLLDLGIFSTKDTDIDALDILPSGDLLMSIFAGNPTQVGTNNLAVDGNDLFIFSLSDNTARLLLDGDAIFVPMPDTIPDIDAVDLLEDGRLALSIRNPSTWTTVDGLAIERQDALLWDLESLTSELLFDGSEVYTSETRGVNALHIVPLNIVVDIKPRSRQNRINPRSRGKVNVAILTTSIAAGDPVDFDALQVNPASVQFGPDGARALRHRVKDVDRDGDPDLLLRFRIRETGIACGDTAATLTGETFSGIAVRGSDFINTVGCRKNSR